MIYLEPKVSYIHKDIFLDGLLKWSEGQSKRRVLRDGRTLEHVSTYKSTLRDNSKWTV